MYQQPVTPQLNQTATSRYIQPAGGESWACLEQSIMKLPITNNNTIIRSVRESMWRTLERFLDVATCFRKSELVYHPKFQH